MKSIILFILALSITVICFAQSNNTESLTITTYYPAPYGVYRDLQARKSLAVGNFTAAEVQSLNSGDIRTSGVIIVGNSTTAVNGALRFNGTGFEGYYGGGWHPLLGDATSGNITAGTLAGSGKFFFTCSGGIPCFLTCDAITSPAICGPHNPSLPYTANARCDPGWMVYNLQTNPGGCGAGCTSVTWMCQKLP
jgi:hypothetical protein